MGISEPLSSSSRTSIKRDYREEIGLLVLRRGQELGLNVGLSLTIKSETTASKLPATRKRRCYSVKPSEDVTEKKVVGAGTE